MDPTFNTVKYKCYIALKKTKERQKIIDRKIKKKKRNERPEEHTLGGNNEKRYLNSKLSLLVSYELGKKPFSSKL